MIKFLQKNSFALSLLSGFLLFLSFTSFFFFAVFIAFLPLLLLAVNYCQGKISGIRFLLLVLISFLLWNSLTTWWIRLASTGGALMAIIANSILMCVVFTLPFFLQKKISNTINLWWIIPFWISFEYLHFHWDLMWPWLTLGNVFAFAPYLAQWYEITGTVGGTLWVLSVNILCAYFILEKNHSKYFFRKITILLIVPVILSISLYLYRNKEIKMFYQPTFNVMIVQPNVDPYNDKFYIEPLIQVNEMYQQIKNYLNDSIDVILLPETFITENIYETKSKEMLEYPSLKFLRDSILSEFPEITIITGANTFKLYSKPKEITATARQNSEGVYYDVFNTALCIYKDSVQIFHKSKLVPGVEKMPYPALFKPLGKLALDLGGTTGSLGRQEKPSLLYVKNKIPVATVICYESVFSDFVSTFFKMGAKTLFVITNDGWWGNTPGYYQHLLFGRLRAIENRTYIARSANTGISAVINPLGEIQVSTPFWVKKTMTTKIPLIHNNTIFSKTGDWISILNIFVLIGLIIKGVTVRKKLQ